MGTESPDKPPEVFDRDREWSALARFIADQRELATLGVVSGRRRQGKTFLLNALVRELGGFFYEAVEATSSESLAMFGEALGRHTGAGAPLRLDDWPTAIERLFELAGDTPLPIVIDEFPYLVQANAMLPSLIQRAIDTRVGPAHHNRRSKARVLLCGSAMSVMGGLLAARAPLRGRAGLELIVPPLGYRDAARFWDAPTPAVAVLIHAIVGGTPAYRDQFVRGDTPRSPADFDDWVIRTVLEPSTPLFREARYLLAEDPAIRDPGLYHSVLAAVAEGRTTAGAIAKHVGRQSAEIAHPLHVLEDADLLVPESDAFRTGRPTYRITEPLVTFYHAIMRRDWARLERGLAVDVWRDAAHRFQAQVVGPHFEALCREYTLTAAPALFGTPATRVQAGVLSDRQGRSQIQIDVVAFGPTEAGAERILSLGEVKWGEVMGLRHLRRLDRARALLTDKGFDTSRTALTCYGGAGFDAELRDAARDQPIHLIDLARIYHDPADPA